MRLFNKCPLSKKFDKRFLKETKEVMVVTADDMSAVKLRDDQYWKVSVPILASIDLKNGELITKKRYLTWEVTEKQRLNSRKIHNISKEKIYLLTIRESIEYENEYTHQLMEQGRWLMVVDVKKRDCQESQLESILQEYQKDVFIQPKGYEKLVLNKSLDIFSGKGIWNNKKCSIHIDSDGEGSTTAHNGLIFFQKLMSDCETWDQKACEYAAHQLTTLANDWAEEDDIEITREDFMKRMTISEVCILSEGNFELHYNDDEMFYGHVIIVSGNINNGFDSADIAG